MKNLNKYLYLLLAGLFLFPACETDFPNPNAPTDEQVLNTREGLLALSVGIKQLYSTSGLRFIIETPAITTREGGITTTFQNMIELEDGASDLPNFNSNTSGLWSTLMRVMVMSDDLIENAQTVDLDNATRNAMTAYGHLFKAMCIGALAQNYEQVIVQPSPNNDAQFVSRQDAYAEAIRLLDQASGISSNPPASFASTALQGLDLENTINAYLARYNLFAGNYDAAISAANQVDRSVVSIFQYDILNPNPIWARVIQNNAPNFKPRDNFGLPESFVFDANDGRLSFYLIPLDGNNQNGLPIEDIKGFFQTDTEPIPTYLPGEMDLIIAEAEARKGSNLDAAVAALDAVLTKTDDPFGVNAGLSAYSGERTANAILLEIFKNRRAELFLTGVSLEDSRRFGRPQPSPTPMTFTDERNRNFYPYPLRERSNNPNTPADPSI